MSELSNRELAERIAVRLFTNGSNQKAERLVLELPGREYGGGWCREAVADLVERALESK